MADDGFNFRAVERREAKRFEPPPWEQDRFDGLARQRAEEAAAEQEAREREAEAAQAAAEDAGAGEDEAVPHAAAAGPTPAKAEAAPDEARMTAMLAELAAEEPSAPQAYWRANVVVGGALVIFGIVFLIWGMAALVAARKTGAAGLLGGSVVLLFGGGFVFGGLYVAVRALRQRGVL